MEREKIMEMISEIAGLDAIMPSLFDDLAVKSFFMKDKGLSTRKELEEYHQSLNNKLIAASSTSPIAKEYLINKKSQSLMDKFSHLEELSNKGYSIIDSVWKNVRRGFSMDEEGKDAIIPYCGELKIYKDTEFSWVYIKHSFEKQWIDIRISPRHLSRKKKGAYNIKIETSDLYPVYNYLPQEIIEFFSKQILSNPKCVGLREFKKIFLNLPEIMDNYYSRILEGKNEMEKK